MYLEFRTARWNTPEHTSFDVELKHPKYGWIPFTADANDPEEFGRSVFTAGVSGEIPVAEFVA